MFQVLLQYFEDRYADFTGLHVLERVKKAIPVLKGITERPNQDLVQGCTVEDFRKH